MHQPERGQRHRGQVVSEGPALILTQRSERLAREVTCAWQRLEALAGHDDVARSLTELGATRQCDRDIVVTLYGEGMRLGGMSYRLDPSLRDAPGRVAPRER